MAELTSSYRPHDPGHDYHSPGIYLITLVVRDRANNATLLGTLNDDLHSPALIPSATGSAVLACWGEIPARQSLHGRKLAIHAAVCMPDHFHGVLEVLEPMDVSVGEVICGFKTGCTQAWRKLMSAAAGQPYTAAMSGSAGAERPYMASCATPAMLHRMSKAQRAAYYAAHPEGMQPLWDDNYDDTICLNAPATGQRGQQGVGAMGQYDMRHFEAMVSYVADNPRRAIVRRLRPWFMERRLHVRLAGLDAEGRDGAELDAGGKVVWRDYAAFGNLFLLRWARKVQVFCHRMARYGMLTDEERRVLGYTWPLAADAKTRVPYEQTEAYRRECEQWEAMVMAGQTVLVTPGISRGERLMKERCLTDGWPLIHLQKEPIGRYWKPEARRFEACSQGRLLILAPWKPEELGEVDGVPSDTDYSMFHNMNDLAREICLFDGEAVLKGE